MNPLPIAKVLQNFARVAKFCRIWSHWLKSPALGAAAALPGSPHATRSRGSQLKADLC